MRLCQIFDVRIKVHFFIHTSKTFVFNHMQNIAYILFVHLFHQFIQFLGRDPCCRSQNFNEERLCHQRSQVLF
jgi:hypothetical protein